MKQKLLQCLMLIAVLLTSSHAFAHDFEVGGIYYNITSSTDKTCEVTFRGSSYSSYSNEYTGSIVIPETVTYNGTTYSVTSIGDKAFNGCIALRELRIEDGESTLSLGCNSYNPSPNSLETGKGLFYDCPLETLYLGRNIEYTDNYYSYSAYPERYGYSAFYNQDKLKSVTIGKYVSSIGNYAFNRCTSLKELRIEDGESTLSLGYNSYNSSGRGKGLFYGCPLETLHLGRNIKYTDYSASFTYSEYPGRFGFSAFYDIKTLKSVTIGNSVTSIGIYAFDGCTSLTSITIPNSVTSIGNYAFEGCSGLTSITIPNSVTGIGEWAFDGCTSLTSITIGNSVTCIGNYAFSDCTSLTSVTIPNSVTGIGEWAFGGCTSLTGITIGNNVTSIGNYAFNRCTSLKELRIEDGESTLSLGYSYNSLVTGKGLFYFCPLETLYLGRNLSYNTGEEYGYSPFYNKTSLRTVTIGENVKNIWSYAFDGCTGLTSVNISDLEAWCKIDFSGYGANPLYYAKKLYLNGELLTDLVIPDSIKDIKEYAFLGCSGLTNITIPNSVTSIGNYAFDACTGLTSITIPNSVTSIGNSAFAGCSGLTGVTIPDGVTSIGDAAFYGCSGLSSITIPNSVTSIGSDALFGCTGLCSIKRNATATTQTKLNFDITNNTEYEFYIKVNNKTYSSKDKTIEIPELAPYSNPSIDYGLRINDRYCKIYSESKYYTKPLNQKLETENGDFYIKAKGSYTEGDATILGTMLSFQKEPTEYDNLNEKTFNLAPNTSYTVYYSVNTKEGGVYSTSKTFTTGALTWSDEEYQATSTTSARLMTATNCDATEGTGFEWRRYGAPENLKPNAVACPVIDGMLIGSLRNLNSEAYYEFRPYYTSSSGNTYYGEWTALFTGDANVYFEPEVRTYEDVKVVTNKATLKGYALAGTDDIISQGFEYWESSVQPGTANSLTASVNSKKVEVSGISMTTTISDLKYGTTYCYRAFATTASGTIYGETVEFTTEKDLSGIENVIVEEDETVEYYNLQGVKIVNPSSGLYIKRQGNKVTKVIL